MSGRPLDVLEASLNEDVTVRLKDGAAFFGRLAGYDQHMNVVLEASDANAGADGGDETDDVNAEAAGSDAEAVEDTTIIRGDNVVTITT
jgi:small nuclear ribonucleoprotein